MSPIDSALKKRFYRFGADVHMSDSGYLNYPEEISIGNEAMIGDGYWFNVITPGLGTPPKIMIGECVQCGSDVILSAINRIELGKNVEMGSNVYISDTDHQFREIGIPIGLQGVTSSDNYVFIGENTIIGSHSVIVGQVTIGRDCIIAPHTVVTKDIPDGFAC